MSKIYTSYFARASKFDDNKFIKVAISNSNPINLPKLTVLVPDWNTIVLPHKSGLITEEEYEKRYIHQLESSQKSIKFMIDQLLNLNKDVVLMCYESTGKFCHRNILAKWINETLNCNIKEYNFNTDTL